MECKIKLPACITKHQEAGNDEDVLPYRHLVDEVPDVPWMGDHRSDGVVGLWDDGTLVHPADAGWFADDVFQGVGLLQLAQVVVLHSDRDVSIPDF